MSGAAVGVVDGDAGGRETLARALAPGGYQVRVYARAVDFLGALETAVPRAAFVSMELRDMDGRELIRVLRANPETRGMALVAVSRGRRRREEVVAGFEAGADEFLEGAFEPELVIARLDSILRRRPAPPTARRFELDGLRLDLDARECLLAGRRVSLTRLEFDLLEHLASHRGRILTRGALVSAVWGRSTTGLRTVDKHVQALRRKLASFSSRVETIVNVGYVLR